MKRMNDAMRGALVDLSTVRKQRTEIAKPEAVFLPDDLRRQVNVLAGRVRFGDHLVSQDPEYHPDAAKGAAKLRELEAPATAERIEQWLTWLALGVANAPAEQSILAGQVRLIHMACGKLPAAVWTDEEMINALDAFKGFWPTPADLKTYLHRRADEYQGDIRQLDRIAKAPPGRGPARELTVPYRPVANTPPEPRRRPLRERGADDFDPVEAEAEDAASRTRAAALLASLGYSADNPVPSLPSREPPPQEPKREGKP